MRLTLSCGALCAALALNAQIAAAQSAPALRTPVPATGPNAPPPAVYPSPPPVTVRNGFMYAVLGDIAQVGPVTGLNLPEFDAVLRVVRGADFVLANQEGMAFNTATTKFPVNEQGALYPSDTTAARDMKNMGIHVLSVANNHSVDYGAESLLENMRLLREAGLAYAGGGSNLREARAATLFTTPKGRVTVVATASTFKQNFVAADGRGPLVDRPGISTIRTTTFQRVTAPEMRLLQQLDAVRNPAARSDTMPRQLEVLDQIYELSDKPGLTYRMNSFDFRDIMQAVHTARRNSDFTVFTIHSHQSETGYDDANPVPADFQVQLYRSVVDAGADVVAGHGNHLLRGIEIYKGKPIFYGLASFVFAGRPAGLNTGFEPRLLHRPPPSGPPSSRSVRPAVAGGTLTMWESFFATTTWENGKLKEVRLYPIDLNAIGNKPKGVPSFASPELANKILEELRATSKQFGTNIQIEGMVGVIRP
jgi:poly-gamma-glutamate capsule biosynthesis protein CapA/YwtB (metallophosphatase superfamily)